MAKAKQVAAALRTIAENLDKEPESEVGYLIVAGYHDNKETFLNFARTMERPIKKEWTDFNLELVHNFMASDKTAYDYAVRHYVRINRSQVCELVKPAKPAVYRCDLLLSDEEEADIDGVTL